MLPVSGAEQLRASGAISGERAGHLREAGVVEHREPGLAGQEQVPQPPGARDVLEVLDDRGEVVPAALLSEPGALLGVHRLGGQHVRGHERLEIGAQLLGSGRRREVHDPIPPRPAAARGSLGSVG